MKTFQVSAEVVNIYGNGENMISTTYKAENNEQKFIDQWFELMAHKLIQMSQMRAYAENQFNGYIAE